MVDAPVKESATLEIGIMHMELLTPTHCAMDRLAACNHWDEKGSVERAPLVAGLHDVELHEIRRWSENDEMGDKFGRIIH